MRSKLVITAIVNYNSSYVLLTRRKTSVWVSPMLYLPSATRIIGNCSEHEHSLSMARTFAQTSITKSRLLGDWLRLVRTSWCLDSHGRLTGLRAECFYRMRYAMLARYMLPSCVGRSARPSQAGTVQNG